jgi:O-antigen/teichoic acid export membrane protein
VSEPAEQPGPGPAGEPGAPRKKPESLRTRVSKAMFWNTVLFPVKAIISLLASLVVANLLRIEGFGAYTSLLAAAAVISLYTDLGLERSLPKFLPEVEHRFGRSGVRLFLQWVLGIKFVLLLVVVGVLQAWAPFFTSFFQLPASDAWLITVLCVLIVLGSLSNIMIQILFAFFKQKAYNLIEILTVLIQPLLTAVLVLLGFGVPGALISLLVTTILILGLQSWQALRAGREVAASTQQVRLRNLLSLFPRFWPYALLIYLINVSSTIYEANVPLMVLNGLGDIVGIGTLALGAKYVREFIGFLVAPQTGVQVPLFSRLFVQGDQSTLQRAYCSFTRLFMLALIPTGVGLILFSQGLIQLLFRQEYSGAAAVAVVLIVGSFLDSMLGSVPHNVLMAYERYRPVVLSRLLILATVPLLFWLAPRYSALGLALGMGVARLAGAAVVLGYAVVSFRLRFPWRFLGRVVLATAAFVAVLLPALWLGRWGIFDSVLPANLLDRIVGILILAGLALLSVVIFLLVFKRLGGLEAEDRERVEELRFPLKKWILRWL